MTVALGTGATFAGYRIESVVGRGGMGIVYRATDLSLERPVALKLVAPEVAVDEGGHAYLTDFGVTKQLGGDTTETGQIVGTLDYISPEQVRGEDVDGRADEYALACVLYECVKGSPPFHGATEAETLWAHMQHPVPPVPGRPALDPVLRKARTRASARAARDARPRRADRRLPLRPLRDVTPARFTVLRMTADVPPGRRVPRLEGAVVDRVIAVPTE